MERGGVVRREGRHGGVRIAGTAWKVGAGIGRGGSSGTCDEWRSGALVIRKRSGLPVWVFENGWREGPTTNEGYVTWGLFMRTGMREGQR